MIKNNWFTWITNTKTLVTAVLFFVTATVTKDFLTSGPLGKINPPEFFSSHTRVNFKKNFSGADLRYMDLSRHDFYLTDLQGAVYNDSTLLPFSLLEIKKRGLVKK